MAFHLRAVTNVTTHESGWVSADITYAGRDAEQGYSGRWLANREAPSLAKLRRALAAEFDAAAVQRTMPRAVYNIGEGGDVPETVLCDECVEATVDPAAARRDIISRDDGAHCFGCDYHANASCQPNAWCEAATAGIASNDE